MQAYKLSSGKTMCKLLVNVVPSCKKEWCVFMICLVKKDDKYERRKREGQEEEEDGGALIPIFFGRR